MHKRGQVELKTKAKQTKSTSWLREEIKSAFAKNSTNNSPPQFSQQQNIKQTNATYIIINKEGTADNNSVSDTSNGRRKETMEYKKGGGGVGIEIIVGRIFFFLSISEEKDLLRVVIIHC